MAYFGVKSLNIGPFWLIFAQFRAYFTKYCCFRPFPRVCIIIGPDYNRSWPRLNTRLLNTFNSKGYLLVSFPRIFLVMPHFSNSFPLGVIPDSTLTYKLLGLYMFLVFILGKYWVKAEKACKPNTSQRLIRWFVVALCKAMPCPWPLAMWRCVNISQRLTGKNVKAPIQVEM